MIGLHLGPLQIGTQSSSTLQSGCFAQSSPIHLHYLFLHLTTGSSGVWCGLTTKWHLGPWQIPGQLPCSQLGFFGFGFGFGDGGFGSWLQSSPLHG